MRILMISDVYFPRINGVSTSISTFIHEYKKLGHLVHLIAPAYQQGESKEDWIFRVPAKKVIIDPEDRMMSVKKLRSLLPKLKSNQYDILHIHTPFIAHYEGIKLARKLKLPTVETYHTFFEEYLYHYVPLLPKAITKFVGRRFSASQCKSIDHLVVPSKPRA